MQNPFRLLVALSVALAPSQAAAQFFARSDDTRTAPPEQRTRPTRLFFDLQAGAALDRGNIDHTGAHGVLGFGARLSDRNELFVEGASDHEIFSGSSAIDKDKGSLLYVYRLADHWNVYAQSTHARNRFLKLTYRTSESIGACLHSFAGPPFEQLLVSVGITPEAQWWDDQTTAFVVRSTGRATFVLRVTANATLGGDVIYMPRISEPSDARVYSQTFLEVKITPEVLGLKIVLSDEYDSRPRPGVHHNDVSFMPVLAIRWKS